MLDDVGNGVERVSALAIYVFFAYLTVTAKEKTNVKERTPTVT
jgi:hypothetical protein